jgi:hypothetical protein
MVKVKDINILNSLQIHQDGEFALVEDEQKIYQYNEGEWQEYKSDQDLGITLYEINQMAVQGLEPLDDEQIEQAKKYIRELTHKFDSKYFMLLCRDLNYYTVFAFKDESENVFEDEVIACLQVLGDIKSVEIYDELIECWITTTENTAHVAYLFNYAQGVIECQ